MKTFMPVLAQTAPHTNEAPEDTNATSKDL